jgi:hypothetical protein
MASLQSTTINGTNAITGALSASNGSVSTSLQFNNHPLNGLSMQSGGQVGASYRTINGFTYKHLGQYQFRGQPGPGRYFDARTNLTGGSNMYMFHVCGYLYNNGQIVSWAGGYTYDPSGPNAILNKFFINPANSHINNTYRSGGKLCIKLDRFSNGYSEGQVDIFFHTHDVGTQNAAVIEAYALNDNAGNHF